MNILKLSASKLEDGTWHRKADGDYAYAYRVVVTMDNHREFCLEVVEGLSAAKVAETLRDLAGVIDEFMTESPKPHSTVNPSK